MLIATATGNLGRNAELRHVNNSTVCEFSLAVKTSFKRDVPPTWVKCSIWGQRAERLVEMLTKGSKVTVVGSLSFREYVAKKGANAGQTVMSVEMEVRDLDFTGGAGSGGGEGSAPAASQPLSIAEAKQLLDDPDDQIPF